MANRLVVTMFALGLLLILSSVITLAVTSGQTASAQVKIAAPVVESNPVTVLQLGKPEAPVKKVTLAFTTGGTLAELMVAQGDTVDRGQLLATLDARMAFAKLDQAKASLARAEAEARLAQFPIKAIIADPEVAQAQSGLDAAQRNADIIQSGWAQRIAEAEARRDQAAAEYSRVFGKYLGLELAGEQLRLSPQELLFKAGIDLDGLFDATLRPTEFGALVFSIPGVGVPLAPVDDQATAWDEALVYGWLNYYDGDLLTDFNDTKAPENGISIAWEMIEAWAPLDDSWAAYDAVALDMAREITGAKNQLTAAKQLLQHVQETNAEPNGDYVDLALAELAAAQADVAVAQMLINSMEIRAPFAGTVAPMGSGIVPGGWVVAGDSVIGLQEVSK